MANTVYNLAVISNPRTGSKSLAAHFSAQIGKTVGHIHRSPYLNNPTLCTEEIVSGRFVIHGHWHTLDQLSASALEYIWETCEIHTINRNPVHSLASTLVLLSKSSTIDLSLVDAVVDMERKSHTEMMNWDNVVYHDFDELYNNMSHKNYIENISRISNWSEVLSYYNKSAAANAA
jgi:hypothetical protein